MYVRVHTLATEKHYSRVENTLSSTRAGLRAFGTDLRSLPNFLRPKKRKILLLLTPRASANYLFTANPAHSDFSEYITAGAVKAVRGRDFSFFLKKKKRKKLGLNNLQSVLYHKRAAGAGENFILNLNKK